MFSVSLVFRVDVAYSRILECQLDVLSKQNATQLTTDMNMTLWTRHAVAVDQNVAWGNVVKFDTYVTHPLRGQITSEAGEKLQRVMSGETCLGMEWLGEGVPQSAAGLGKDDLTGLRKVVLDN